MVVCILSSNPGMFEFVCWCLRWVCFENTMAPPKCILLELILWEKGQDWCPGRSLGAVLWCSLFPPLFHGHIDMRHSVVASLFPTFRRTFMRRAPPSTFLVRTHREKKKKKKKKTEEEEKEECTL